MKSSLFATAITVLATVTATQAQIVVYDNLSTPATAGTSRPSTETAFFGDVLNLTQGGTLSKIGLSLFNSTTGPNTGSILTGTTMVSIYDNTVPYAGGAIANPLLGTASVNWDFTADGGLLAGYYTTELFDIAALGITVPQNVLVTQTFSQTTGTSTRYGAVLLGDPTVGTSPATVYLNNSVNASGLYTFTGNPSQLAYQLQVIPEPATGSLLGLGVLCGLVLRRRGQA